MGQRPDKMLSIVFHEKVSHVKWDMWKLVDQSLFRTILQQSVNIQIQISNSKDYSLIFCSCNGVRKYMCMYMYGYVRDRYSVCTGNCAFRMCDIHCRWKELTKK